MDEILYEVGNPKGFAHFTVEAAPDHISINTGAGLFDGFEMNRTEATRMATAILAWAYSPPIKHPEKAPAEADAHSPA